MSNQTLPRTSARSGTKSSTKSSTKTDASAPKRAPSTTYRRQTARAEGRRDGKALIFGWGKHLSRTQKAHVQQLTLYGFFGLVVVSILGVVAFGIVNETVLIPNSTIASVNNVHITQDFYRKTLAYDAQTIWNTIQSEVQQQNGLQAALAKGDAKATNENQILTSEIESNEAAYQQAQVTTQAAREIVENQLIVQGATHFEQADHVPASTFEPSSADITKALASFKKAFPTNEKYADFLSQDSLSEQDVRAAIAIHLRRNKMQTYLASRIVSPAPQIHVRRIETSTAAQAQTVLNQLTKQHGSWSTLAKKDSLDTNSKDKGGDAGWIAKNTYDAGLEQWIFAPGRKVNDISPVLKDATGTFDVVQILGFDKSKAINSTTLSTAKQNALTSWLAGQKVNASNHLTTPIVSMVNASRNLPVLPNLSATLPTESPVQGAASSLNGSSGSSTLPSTGTSTTKTP